MSDESRPATDAAAAARALLNTVRDRLRGGYVASDGDARVNALRTETARAYLELAWLELEVERRERAARTRDELARRLDDEIQRGLRPIKLGDGEG